LAAKNEKQNDRIGLSHNDSSDHASIWTAITDIRPSEGNLLKAKIGQKPSRSPPWIADGSAGDGQGESEGG